MKLLSSLILLCLFSLLYKDFSFIDIYNLDEINTLIVYSLRLPRILLAVIVGGVLANVGWSYQILFRNPLATPYTLGVSSLAALALAISELLFEKYNLFDKNLLFVLLIIPIVFIFKHIKKGDYRNKILMLGVCIGIICSSFIVLIQSLLGNESVAKLVRWMMGSLNVVGLEEVIIMGSISLIGTLFIFIKRKELTMLSIGEEFSKSRGINTKKIFNITILSSFAIVSSVIWLCGPIGFVGLIIPHISKKVWGSNYSVNFINNFLLGSIFLVSCDFLSRNITPTMQLPIGAITALIGGPLLIYQVLKARN